MFSKTQSRGLVVAAIIVCTVGLLLPACQQQAPQPPAGSGPQAAAELSGTIRVSGAWALYPMVVRWGEEFTKLHPKVRVDISAGGAGKGVADALAQLVDIGMVSREIRQQETEKGGFFVPVAKDAVFPTINSANPYLAKGLKEKGVTREMLIELYITGTSKTWGDLAGTGGGEKVQVYTRSDSCGAAETWAKYLGAMGQEELQGVAVYGDPGVAEAVRRDIVGLGFNNLNFVFDAKTGEPMPGITTLPLDVNGNGKIDPGETYPTKKAAIDAVANGVYPSPPARDLNLLTKDKFTGLTKVFVQWILNDGQKFLDEVGYIPIAADVLDNAKKKAAL